MHLRIQEESLRELEPGRAEERDENKKGNDEGDGEIRNKRGKRKIGENTGSENERSRGKPEGRRRERKS